jgi:hypothetical protein
VADTFTCHWINRLDQFNAVSIDLTVVHDQGVIPSERISKNYHKPYATVTATFLEEEAANEVDRIVDAWNAENPV